MDWLGSVCPVVKVSGTLKISCFTISGCIANKLANQDSLPRSCLKIFKLSVAFLCDFYLCGGYNSYSPHNVRLKSCRFAVNTNYNIRKACREYTYMNYPIGHISN